MTTMAQLARQIDALTVEHLRVVVRGLPTSSASELSGVDVNIRALATEVLRFFFGNVWTHRNTASVPDGADPFRHHQQVATLAENAFNLQGIEGVRHRLGLMRHHNLETALAESESAVLLSAPEFRFRFVVPTRTQRQDYQGEVFTSDQRGVCCRIHSRSEPTEADLDSLQSTLHEARRHLPKGRLGMLVPKIPGAVPQTC